MKLTRWGLLTAAVVSVVAVFSKMLFSQFVWDDVFLIAERSGLGELGTFVEQITAPFWQNSGYVLGNNTDYWRPLTSALLWLGGALFGDQPAGFHLFSLVACLGAGIAFVALLVKLLPAGADRRPAIWLGILFVAHPLCAEVACMVSNISDHLVLIFLALELGLLVDMARGAERKGSLLLVALFSFLACSSKEIGVLGALAPLAAWLMVSRAAREEGVRPARWLLSAKPWIAAAASVALFLLLRQLVIWNATETSSLRLISSLDTSWRIFVLGFGLALEKSIVPNPSGFHIYLDSDAVPIGAWLWAAGAFALLAATTAIGFVRSRRLTLPAIGLLLALVVLSPSLLTIRASDPLLAFPVRYFHLPLAGFLIALLPLATRYWKQGVRFALPIAVALLLMLSWIRIDEWKSDISLFYAEARYNEQSAQTLVNLGAALCGEGAYDEAERVAGLIEDLPERSDGHGIQSGLAFIKGSIAAHRDKDLEAASAHFEEALKKDPTDMVNVFALARIRDAAGHPEQAVVILEKALEAPWFQDQRREKLKARLEEFRKKLDDRAASQKK